MASAKMASAIDVRIDDVGSILKVRIGFPFGENSAGFCKPVWLQGSILNFQIASVSYLIGGLIAATLFADTVSDSQILGAFFQELGLGKPRPARRVFRALRALPESDRQGVPKMGSVPRGVSGALRAPGSGVSKRCPESVPGVSGHFRHSWDAFLTLRSLGPEETRCGTLPWTPLLSGDTLSVTLRDTSGPKGSSGWSGLSQNWGGAHAAGKWLQTNYGGHVPLPMLGPCCSQLSSPFWAYKHDMGSVPHHMQLLARSHGQATQGTGYERTFWNFSCPQNAVE